VNLMDSEARSVTVKPRERAEGSQPWDLKGQNCNPGAKVAQGQKNGSEATIKDRRQSMTLLDLSTKQHRTRLWQEQTPATESTLGVIRLWAEPKQINRVSALDLRTLFHIKCQRQQGQRALGTSTPAGCSQEFHSSPSHPWWMEPWTRCRDSESSPSVYPPSEAWRHSWEASHEEPGCVLHRAKVYLVLAQCLGQT
jgi:hypothetical protein